MQAVSNNLSLDELHAEDDAQDQAAAGTGLHHDKASEEDSKSAKKVSGGHQAAPGASCQHAEPCYTLLPGTVYCKLDLETGLACYLYSMGCDMSKSMSDHTCDFMSTYM